jgi:hypothetical protein
VCVDVVAELDDESPVLGVAVDTVSVVGAELLRRDVSAAVNLFNDFLFPRLISAIRQESAISVKLHHILKLLYVYTPEDAPSHYQVGQWNAGWGLGPGG